MPSIFPGLPISGRLEEQGTSFRQLKNEVIYQLSTKALSESWGQSQRISL